MKKTYLYSALAFSLLMASCGKDFLIETPTDVISSEDLADAVAMDPGLLAGNIAGLYTMTFDTGTGGTTGHDDFGQKGYDIYLDMLVSDMVLAGDNYGWYSGIARYTTPLNFTVNAVYQPWRYYYRLIFSANGIIDALGGNDADTELEGESRHFMGQAKAIRANSYFYLANLYSREGYGTGNEPILPIYTDPSQPNQPLSTSSEVYDLIVSDLRDAISLLSDFQRSTKDQIDANVAKGMLAYALTARGTNADLQEVVTLTDEILSAYPLTTRTQAVAILNEDGALTNPESGFNNVNTGSWMWGIDLTLDIGLNLISWWGQVDYFTYSYASVGDYKTIDAGLYDKIPDNDIRKGQFRTAEPRMPWGKFFTPQRVPQGQRYIETDYLYMRSDEMVLLNAEAHARLNNANAAITSLSKLLNNRVDDISYLSTLSGDALLDEIYLQTRIELWGEGKTYLAMKRNKRSVTKGSNHLFLPGTSYNYNAEELSFPIPEQEVLNNPHL